MSVRFDGAMLFVKDFARMREFYAALLGSAPVNTEWADTWAVFDAGGAQFALHAIPAEFARGITSASPLIARESGPVKLLFTVEDVVQECARLTGMGVTLLPRPWQKPDEACDAVDPEGNVFQIRRVRS